MTKADEPKPDLLGDLSAEELQFVIDFARYVAGARRMGLVIKWLGGVSLFLAMLAYYVLAFINSFHIEKR